MFVDSGISYLMLLLSEIFVIFAEYVIPVFCMIKILMSGSKNRNSNVLDIGRRRSCFFLQLHVDSQNWSNVY